MFALVKDDVIAVKSCRDLGGMESIPDGACCGMVRDGMGGWKIPEPSPEVIAAIRRAEIVQALEVIDRKSIRSIREGDAVRVAQYEADAAKLRTELAALNV